NVCDLGCRLVTAAQRGDQAQAVVENLGPQIGDVVLQLHPLGVGQQHVDLGAQAPAVAGLGEFISPVGVVGASLGGRQLGARRLRAVGGLGDLVQGLGQGAGIGGDG